MLKLSTKLYCNAMALKEKAVKMLKNEQGDTNIIAIIIILAIVIALAIVFREAIFNLFNKIWDSLFKKVEDAI